MKDAFPIQLWTWQSVDHDITQCDVKLERSYYYNECPERRPKYQAVYKRLRTCQLLWCFTEYRGWNQIPGNPRVLWTLKVPIGEVECFVDEWLADRLIRNQPCPEIAAWRLWRREAVRQYPKRPDRQNKFINTKIDEYRGSLLGSEDGWRGIFLDAAEIGDGISAVLCRSGIPRWDIKRLS